MKMQQLQCLSCSIKSLFKKKKMRIFWYLKKFSKGWMIKLKKVLNKHNPIEIKYLPLDMSFVCKKSWIKKILHRLNYFIWTFNFYMNAMKLWAKIFIFLFGFWSSKKTSNASSRHWWTESSQRYIKRASKQLFPPVSPALESFLLSFIH